MIPSPLDLKPCPFCGGPAKLYELVQIEGSPKEWSVCCQNCTICFPTSRRKPEAAITAWNHRPAPKAPALAPSEPLRWTVEKVRQAVYSGILIGWSRGTDGKNADADRLADRLSGSIAKSAKEYKP